MIQGKLLCSFHGFDVNVKTYDRTYYRPLAFYGDHFTVNTNYTKDRALALGFPEKKISILHAGVDAAHFHPKSKLERTNGVFNILCVGRLVEKKGLIYAIAAMKLLDGFSCRDFRLDIVGDGPLNELLQVEIRRNGLSRFITMHGASTRDEVLDFMKVADVFLLPSVAAGNGDSEGQGLVLQEAQAMEIPVIASSHNGFPEGLRDGVTGFLVPEKNPLAIAERLLYLMENETVRRQMGRQGRLFVERKFEINILNKQLIQLYLKMLEE